MSKLFEGKVGVVLGVANQHSIASGVSRVLNEMGAELAFNFLPDEKGKDGAKGQESCRSMGPPLLFFLAMFQVMTQLRSFLPQ